MIAVAEMDAEMGATTAVVAIVEAEMGSADHARKARVARDADPAETVVETEKTAAVTANTLADRAVADRALTDPDATTEIAMTDQGDLEVVMERTDVREEVTVVIDVPSKMLATRPPSKPLLLSQPPLPSEPAHFSATRS